MSRITINSNIASLTAQRRLSDSTKELRSTFEKLSSGLRITRAGDDAAGLAVSELLNVDQRVYSQGVRNLNDGVSALSIAGAALKELSSIVIRIRELATQSANGVLGPKQREALDQEAQELSREFTRITQTTEFNGIGLLDGETQEFRFQGGYGSAQTIISGLGGAMGMATFTRLASFGTQQSESCASALGDLNGDGVIDIVTAGTNGAGQAIVFLGQGDGTFAELQTLATEGSCSLAISLGDLNSDGVLDLITAGQSGGTAEATVFLGQGDGTFVEVATLQTEDFFYSRALSLGDVNGDGMLDVVTAGSEGVAEASVFLGHGDGTFSQVQTLTTSGLNLRAVSFGDLNNDSLLDIITAGDGGSATVFLGQRNGTFTQAQELTTEAHISHALSIGDLNADGVLDLVTAGYNGVSGEATVFLGQGDGSFARFQTLATEGTYSNALSLGDLNGDGVLDLMTAGYGDAAGEATIFLGSGDGTFAKVETVVTEGKYSNTLSLGDLNGDGVLDLVTAGYNGLGGETNVFLANTQHGTSSILAFDLKTQAGARQSMAVLDRKLSSLSTQQGIIGAFEAQLQVELGNLDSARENYIAARSRITDADIAEEAARLARLQILQSASTSVLGQANLQPQIAIQLINGV